MNGRTLCNETVGFSVKKLCQVRERLLVAYYRYSGEAGHSSHFDIVRLSFQSPVLHFIVGFAGVRFAEADRV